MNKKSMFLKRLVVVSIVAFLGSSYYLKTPPFSFVQNKSRTISTVYGSVNVTEPVLLEILDSKAMERLKNINQYGIMAFIRPDEKYTRYEHSLAVFYLLRKFGASLEEQTAGLIHDISHTAFSHVADFIHDSHLNKYSYQDTIFRWYLTKTGILNILKKHNLERVADFGSGVEYKMLKDDLPNLCADRLEYNLFGGLVEGWITPEEIRTIVSHIVYKDGQWIFTNKDSAKRFAKISIDLSVQNWSSAENGFVSTVMASILKRGFVIQVITQDDFHFSTDQVVWDTLRACKDKEIIRLFNKLDNYKNSYTIGTPDKYDLYFKGKFRGIDPLVSIDGKIDRLTAIDPSFVQYLKAQHVACKDQYIVYI